MNKNVQRGNEVEKDEDYKMLNQLYPEVQYNESELDRQQENNKINLVIIGHVDSGKSTLMGHFLYKIGEVHSNEMHKYEKLSQNYGKSSFKFAYVFD